MKKLFPFLLAGVVFVPVLALLRPAPAQAVVVAARDLPAGHLIAEGDVELHELPADLVPTEALTDVSGVIGQTVAMDRVRGDLILPGQLGEVVRLQANERAVAVTVTDSSGLAGLLKPGDQVGVTAVIFQQGSGGEGAFSKVTVEGLRVLYLSPSFKALDPVVSPSDEETGLVASEPQSRSKEGAVVLAVPVSAQAVAYDFTGVDAQSPSASRTVNALELLTALDAAGNATLSLYLLPEMFEAFSTSGLWLPDLVITPGPTPTPTLTLPGSTPAVETTPATQKP